MEARKTPAGTNPSITLSCHSPEVGVWSSRPLRPATIQTTVYSTETSAMLTAISTVGSGRIADRGGAERQHHDGRDQAEVDGDRGSVDRAPARDHAVMSQPIPGDDREGDQERDELWPDGVAECRHARERRRFVPDVERGDQQRQRNREGRIKEGDRTVELGLVARVPPPFWCHRRGANVAGVDLFSAVTDGEPLVSDRCSLGRGRR